MMLAQGKPGDVVAIPCGPRYCRWDDENKELQVKAPQNMEGITCDAPIATSWGLPGRGTRSTLLDKGHKEHTPVRGHLLDVKGGGARFETCATLPGNALEIRKNGVRGSVPSSTRKYAREASEHGPTYTSASPNLLVPAYIKDDKGRLAGQE